MQHNLQNLKIKLVCLSLSLQLTSFAIVRESINPAICVCATERQDLQKQGCKDWNGSIAMEIGEYLVSLSGKHQFVEHWKFGRVKDSCFRKLSEIIGVECYGQVSDTCTTRMSSWSKFLIFVVGTKSENWVPVPALNLLAGSFTPMLPVCVKPT